MALWSSDPRVDWSWTKALMTTDEHLPDRVVGDGRCARVSERSKDSRADGTSGRLAWRRCGMARWQWSLPAAKPPRCRSRSGRPVARHERPRWNSPTVLCRGTVFLAALSLIAPATATAGPEVAACPAPLGPRRALPSDGVCVSPQSRSRVAAENSRAPLLWVPGPFGPKTCANGYVWREATPVDFTCVTPDIRTLVRSEQANPHLPAGQ
jgi:hypothetical protein